MTNSLHFKLNGVQRVHYKILFYNVKCLFSKNNFFSDSFQVFSYEMWFRGDSSLFETHRSHFEQWKWTIAIRTKDLIAIHLKYLNLVPNGPLKLFEILWFLNEVQNFLATSIISKNNEVEASQRILTIKFDHFPENFEIKLKFKWLMEIEF